MFAWAVIVTLIGINALYVAAEFATVSVRRGQIQQRAENGEPLARRLLPYISDGYALDRYIAACQIGITLSSLILGAFGQATLAGPLAGTLERLTGLQSVAAQSTAALAILIGLTVSQMILGELVPKSVALQFPARTALWTVIPMQWSLRVLAWFIVVLNGSGIAILRLLRAEQTGHRHIHSPDEIELLIVESREGGVLKPIEQQRLTRALRLSIRSVRDVMTPRTRIEALALDSPAAEVLETATTSPHTRLPVYDESIDQVIGVVHTRDVAVHALAGGALPALGTLMRAALFVPDSMTTDQVLVRLREGRRQIAVVLDEFGGTAGLVTMDDVLEEVIGEVADEFKPADAVVEQLPDGRVRLPGRIAVDEAASWINTAWDGDAHTVAGRVMDAFGRVPGAGERLEIDGVLVEVERVQHHAIESVIATPAPAQQEDED